MLAVRLLYLIGFIALSGSPAWAQVDTGEPDNGTEIETEFETEIETETSTDCVENKTCQKVQSEDDKQKVEPDSPTGIEVPIDAEEDEPIPEE